MTKTVFAVRGAITVEANTKDEILNKTRFLLQELAQNNQIQSEEEIISIFFTATSDLNACFPAKAARNLGWNNTALMCAQEIDVKGGLPHCIRVMIHYYSENPNHKPHPVYLKEAHKLRPDIDNRSQ